MVFCYSSPIRQQGFLVRHWCGQRPVGGAVREYSDKADQTFAVSGLQVHLVTERDGFEGFLCNCNISDAMFLALNTVDILG